LATVVAAAEGFDDAEVGPKVISGGGFVVRMPSAAIFGLSIRRSVGTRMAVGQLAVFRSVARSISDALKIASYAHFIGIPTLRPFGSTKLGRRGVLTRAVDRPSLLEVGPAVALGVLVAGK
jgi:hypothetical protein